MQEMEKQVMQTLLIKKDPKKPIKVDWTEPLLMQNIARTCTIPHDEISPENEDWSICSSEDHLYIGKNNGVVDVYRIESEFEIFYEKNFPLYKSGCIRDMKIMHTPQHDILISVRYYTIKLSKLPDFEEIYSYTSNNNSAFGIGVLPEQHYVTCHHWGNLIFHKGEKIIKDLRVHENECKTLDVFTMNSNTYVVSGGIWDQKIFITKFSTNPKEIRILREIGSHQSLVTKVKAVGKFLVSTSSDEIIVWDPFKMKEVKCFKEKRNSTYALEKLTSTKFVVGGAKRVLKVFDIETMKEIQKTQVCHSSTIRVCNFIREKNLLVSGSLENNWWFYKDDLENISTDRRTRIEFLKTEMCAEDDSKTMICNFIELVCKEKIDDDDLALSIYYTLYGFTELIDMRLLFKIYDYFDKCEEMSQILCLYKSFCLSLFDSILEDDIFVILFLESFISKETVEEVIKNKKFSCQFVAECFASICKSKNFAILKRRIISSKEGLAQLFEIKDLQYGLIIEKVKKIKKVLMLIRYELYENRENNYNMVLSSSNNSEMVRVQREYLISESNFFFLTYKNYWSTFPSEVSVIELLDSETIKKFVEFLYTKKIKDLGSFSQFLDLLIVSIQFFELKLREYLFFRINFFFDSSDKDLLRKQICTHYKKISMEIPEKFQKRFFNVWERSLGEEDLNELILWLKIQKQ